MANTKYTFLPWIRKGISSVLTTKESDTPSGTEGPRPAIQAKVNFETNSAGDFDVTKEMSLMGPGDVIGVSESEVIRVDPMPLSSKLESNYLPIMEFYSEDLPWRYTPLAPHGTNEEKLRPWFFLAVLKEGNDMGTSEDTTDDVAAEFELPQERSKRYFTFSEAARTNISQILPPSDQVWAWAHVHVNDSLTDGYSGDMDAMKAAISANPNLAFSRVISPRRLEPNTKYRCFLIPTFETGRLAGLSESYDSIPYFQPSWDLTNFTEENAKFPYYYDWSFKTAADGDFETLANKIRPRAASTLETTVPFDIGNCGINVPPQTNNIMEFEGALVAPGFTSVPFREEAENADFVNNLSGYLNQGVLDGSDLDPTLVASAQGKWIVDQDEFDGSNPNVWYKDLNLDPRNRAVAGLGADIVKEFQEEFMIEAWEQLDEVTKANQKIREAKLIGKAGQRLLEKHIVPRAYSLAGDSLEERKARSRILGISRGNILDQIDVEGQLGNSVQDEVTESAVPNAMFSGVFKKIARPGRRMSRSLTQGESGSLIDSLIADANDGEITIGTQGEDVYPFFSEAPIPDGSISQLEMDGFVSNLQDTDGTTAPGTINAQSMWNDVNTQLGNESTTLKQAHAIDTEYVRQEIDPLTRVTRELTDHISIWNPDSEAFEEISELNQIMAYPELDFPLYEYLEKITKHAIIPNLQDIPENSVTLMETNPKFIEAIMMGANQEMAKELLWRKYPTDQKGSYFRMFWDKSDAEDAEVYEDQLDIDEHTSWSGSNALGAQQAYPDRLILVLRGELFDKFPGTQIFASKAIIGDHDGDDATPDQRTHSTDNLMPEFTAKLGNDLRLVAFNLTAAEALTGGNGEGYYFVFQERMGELRFGLDENNDENPPSVSSWNDMHWNEESFSDMIKIFSVVPGIIDQNNQDLLDQWGESSSRMAMITNQKPIYFKIHSSELIQAN